MFVSLKKSMHIRKIEEIPINLPELRSQMDYSVIGYVKPRMESPIEERDYEDRP